MRIVSLLPSTTEIVFDLGLSDQLFGVTFECNFPSDASNGREIVVGGMDTKHLTPFKIDELVRERMAAGGGLYTLDEDALSSCNPDLILSQDLCRVCAVPSGDVSEACARLNTHASVLQIDPQNLLEVIQSIQTVADAAGVSERGHKLVDLLMTRLDSLQERVTLHLGETARPRVFVLEWVDPPFLSGHWVPDIVSAAGGNPVLALPGERSVQTDWQTIAASNPEHIFISPCGFDLDGASAQAIAIMDKFPLDCAIWAIDADAVIVRPGPRLVDGAQAVAAALFGPQVAGLEEIPDHLIRRLR
jgi:iron complex transport system substrate-binding protein